MVLELSLNCRRGLRVLSQIAGAASNSFELREDRLEAADRHDAEETQR